MYIYLYVFISYCIHFKELNLLYSGSWPRGVSEGAQVLPCLLLAPESTGSWGKKDVKQGQDRQAGWRWSWCLPSWSSLRIWSRSQGSCQQKELAGAQLPPQANMVSLWVSHSTLACQQLLAPRCCSVVPNSLQPPELPHTRLPCPSVSSRICSNSCPLNRRWHPTISSHPLSSPSPPALYLSQHQGLFQWVGASHQVAKALEFQLQHQSFQWTPRTDLL